MFPTQSSVILHSLSTREKNKFQISARRVLNLSLLDGVIIIDLISSTQPYRLQMFRIVFLCLLIGILFQHGSSFVRIKNVQAPRVKPVHENFFLDIAEDPEKNTPRQIFGEVTYKNFVGSYNPDALLLGNYDVVSRVRVLKLLSLTADAGLLEALESKGLTLSKVEKLLPLIDRYNLLPIILKNKELALTLAPLLIEPAPVLLPVAVSLLKTPPTTFTLPGATLVAFGAYEFLDNSLFGFLIALLGTPLLALGTILSGSISIPDAAIETDVEISVVDTPARPSAAKLLVAAVEASSASVSVKFEPPKVSKITLTNKDSKSLNGQRKTIKIK